MNRSVLVVDDEPLTRNYLKRTIAALEPDFSEIELAENGIEAYHLYEKKKFDLVITDIRMPVMDGLSLSKKIREIKQDQLIIILSGYDEFSYAQQAISIGVHGYLLKPIENDKLKEMLLTVQNILNTRSERKQHEQMISEISEDYKEHIAREYLESLAEQNPARQRAVFPFLRRFSIELFCGSSVLISIRPDLNAIAMHDDVVDEFDHQELVLLQALSDISAKRSSVSVCYFYSGGHFLIVSSLNGDAQETAIKLCTEFSDFIYMNMGILLHIGISSEFFQSERFSVAMHQAQNAAMFHSLKKAESVVIYQDDVNEKLLQLQVERKALLNSLNENSFTAIATQAGIYLKLRTVFPELSDSAFLLYPFLPRPDDSLHFNENAYRTALSQLCKSSDSLSLRLQNALSSLNGLGCRRNNEAEPYQSGILVRAKEYIHQNFQKQISLTDIAEYVQLSPNYLSSLWSQHSEESYIKYLTRVRMENAARLLSVDPHAKISEVAYQCGFYSVKHFHYVFKQRYQQTPSAFQQSQREISLADKK